MGIVIFDAFARDEQRRRDLDQENARARVAAEVRAYHSRLEAERRRLAARRAILERTKWFAWGAALGLVVGALVFGRMPW